MAIIHYHNSCKSYNYLYCCRSYNYQPASILQRCNALLQRRCLSVLNDGCADAALVLRPQPWLGSRADPGSNRGPDLARYRAPATDRVRNCRSYKRGMQWEAMGRVQDAGWVAGVTCKIATMALKILVEAPGFRCSSSCSQKCRIGWHCSHPGRLMDDADQLGASHGSCKRAIESSATTIIN